MCYLRGVHQEGRDLNALRVGPACCNEMPKALISTANEEKMCRAITRRHHHGNTEEIQSSDGRKLRLVSGLTDLSEFEIMWL